MTKTSTLGSGFVGERVGRGLISLGNDVIFYDIADKNLPNFTKDINYAVENSDVSFICVPTPTVEGKIDLSYIEEANSILATKISYWNEVFLICKKLGIDSRRVADIVGLDHRIGKYGTVHGKAFGGKCLPKDLKAFVSLAKEYKEARLLEAVDEVNEKMHEKYGVRE